MANQSIFISYAREDAHQFALRLYHELSIEAYPIVFWIDSGGHLETEEPILMLSQIEIQTATIILIILSPQWSNSGGCRQEFLAAQQFHKPVLPIFMEAETPLPVELQEYEFTLEAVSFALGFEPALEALCTRIDEIWFRGSTHILQMLQKTNVEHMVQQLKDQLFRSESNDDEKDQDDDPNEDWDSWGKLVVLTTNPVIANSEHPYFTFQLEDIHSNSHENLGLSRFIRFIAEIPTSSVVETPPLAHDLMNEGERLYYYGYYRQALGFFLQAVKLCKDTDDFRTLALGYRNIGQVHCTLGDLKPARKYMKKAIRLHRKLKDITEESIDLDNLGVVANYYVQYYDALDYHLSAYIRAKQVNNPVIESNALGNMGNAYRSLKEYDKAIVFLEDAIHLAREHSLKRNEGRFLSNLGRVFHALGDNDRAAQCYREALNIAVQESDRSGEGYRLRYLGLFYLEQGKLDIAEGYFLAALHIANEIDHLRIKGRALCSLANVYFQERRYQEAIECLNQANEIAVKMKVPFEEVYCQLFLGRIRLATTNVEKAMENINRGIAKFCNMQRDDRYAQLADIDIRLHRREVARFQKLFKESCYPRRKNSPDIEALAALTDDLLIRIFDHHPKRYVQKHRVSQKPRTIPSL